MTNISYLFIVAAFFFVQSTSLAKEEFNEDTDDGNEVIVEERTLTKYKDSAQIQKKLSDLQKQITRNSNRYEVMAARLKSDDAKIATLQANLTTIKFSLRIECAKTDYLLDTGVEATTSDCCQTGYYILCLSRAITKIMDDFVKNPAGTCDICPASVTPLIN